jgi:DNA polymerase-4
VSRTILHVDLDAFFASVEQRDDPSLRGKPVLVGGSRERGVVAAASYEARRYGIHSAMPMAEALRRCPQAMVVRHHMDRYVEASRAFFQILGDFSPLVEGLSVDEAFVDLTGSERLLGAPVSVARRIKKRVQSEIELVASVGVAPTKFAAKIASDIDKPDGLRVVSAEGLLDFLHPLPISRLWGVGKVGQEKLAALGLRLIGDVAAYPEGVLAKRLGPAMAAHLCALARGVDPRSVEPGRDAVSIGHEETFEHDIGDPARIESILLRQADKVARRLRSANLRCRIVVLKIKHADFRQLTRRRTLDGATSDGRVIARCAIELLRRLEISDERGKETRVRLCGISAAGLEDRDGPRQLGFDEAERQRGEVLGETLDRIQDRFGDAIVGRAIHKDD